METNCCMFRSGMAKSQNLSGRLRTGKWSWWAIIIFGCGDELDTVYIQVPNPHNIMVKSLTFFCLLTAPDLWGHWGRSHIREGIKSIKSWEMSMRRPAYLSVWVCLLFFLCIWVWKSCIFFIEWQYQWVFFVNDIFYNKCSRNCSEVIQYQFIFVCLKNKQFWSLSTLLSWTCFFNAKSQVFHKYKILVVYFTASKVEKAMLYFL